MRLFGIKTILFCLQNSFQLYQAKCLGHREERRVLKAYCQNLRAAAQWKNKSHWLEKGQCLLITSEFEFSSYNSICVTKSSPKSSVRLFMVFVDECEDFATSNQRLIYQSLLFSATCLSFLADLSSSSSELAPQHTC